MATWPRRRTGATNWRLTCAPSRSRTGYWPSCTARCWQIADLPGLLDRRDPPDLREQTEHQARKGQRDQPTLPD